MVELGIFVGGSVLVFVAFFRRDWLLYWGFAVSIVMMAPNIGGYELGVAGAVLATLLLVGIRAFNHQDMRPVTLRWLPVWYCASVVVLISNGWPLLSGALDVAVVVSAVVAACTALGRKVLVKTFVGLCVLVSVLYCVTVAGWLAMGFYSIIIGQIPGGYGYPIPLHFPFTITMSSVQVFGNTVPRLSGFAREPGWMAMYMTVAYFLFRYAGWSSRLLRASLLMGVLGTLSTAGFGIFVVAAALSVLIAHRRKWWVQRFIQRMFGLALMVAGVWVAWTAPVVGFAAKAEQNAISYSERGTATELGWNALLQGNLSGGAGDSSLGNINLVASVAEQGLLFPVFVILAVLVPFSGGLFTRARVWKERKWGIAPPVGAVLGTLMFAQPSNGSVFVFVLVATIVAAGAGHHPTPTRTPTPAKTGRVPALAGAGLMAGSRTSSAAIRSLPSYADATYTAK